jgi:hypothetical protein
VSRGVLPAAAIDKGCTIIAFWMDENYRRTGVTEEVTIKRILHGTPKAGSVTMFDEQGREWRFGGSEKVEVIALPA